MGETICKVPKKEVIVDTQIEGYENIPRFRKMKVAMKEDVMKLSKSCFKDGYNQALKDALKEMNNRKFNYHGYVISFKDVEEIIEGLRK